MDRKKFIIIGLLLIHLHLLLLTTTLYQLLSGTISEHIRAIASTLLILPVLGFGILLFKRFQTTEVTQWALIPCLLIYVMSFAVISPICTWYDANVLRESAAMKGLFRAIPDNVQVDGFPVQNKLNFILISLPLFYIGCFGGYLMLLLGVFDPRKPSGNKAVLFFQSVFKRRNKSNLLNKPNLMSA